MADRRTTRVDRVVDRRVEGLVLTAVAVLSRKRFPTAVEVRYQLHDLDQAVVDQALLDMERRGLLAVIVEPAAVDPLFSPRVIRYRPLALSSGASLGPDGKEGR